MHTKIKIYIIARISKDMHDRTDKVCHCIDHKDFDVFVPKDHNPWNKKHTKLSREVFDIDLQAIKTSDIGLILPEYGKDCAREAGFFAHSKKPTVVFIHKQTQRLRDRMVKGGVDYVITIDPSTHDKIQQDPILQHKKLLLLKNQKNLDEELKKIYQERYGQIFIG